MRSASRKSRRSDRAAVGVPPGLRWVNEMRGGSAAYGEVFAVAANAAVSGRAAASNWVIGRNPRISSMVRMTDDWLYIVLSTIPRRVYGEMANITERCEST